MTLSAVLRAARPALLADVKFRSPRDGVLIAPERLAEYVRALIDGGVAAFATPTNQEHFGGSLELAARIRELTELPLLRKEFFRTVAQLDESKAVGFDAVQLSVRTVSAPGLLERLCDRAGELGLEVVIGVHDERDLARALGRSPAIVAVNNRDLGTLERDGGTVGRTESLLPRIPPEVLVISESGLETAADVTRAVAAGADAVLVGAALARSADPAVLARELLRAARAGGVDGAV